ncbi:MAG: hypothetical protein M5U28_54900 [Sandaracinaceae bacterium]|nr:hypothetical protein [Sandaracinaceae bacterium]
MTNEKRPAPADGAPVSEPAAPSPEEAEPDFFSNDEHDGWSPIVKRSTTPPEPPTE